MKTKLLLFLLTFSYALTYSQGTLFIDPIYIDKPEDLSTWNQTGTEFNFIDGNAFYPASKNTNNGLLTKSFNLTNSEQFLIFGSDQFTQTGAEKIKITSTEKITPYILTGSTLFSNEQNSYTKSFLKNISVPSSNIIKVNDSEFIINPFRLALNLNFQIWIVIDDEISNETPITITLYKEDTTKDVSFKNINLDKLSFSEIPRLATNEITKTKPILTLNVKKEFELTNVKGNIEIYNNLGQQIENRNIKNGIYHIRVSSKNVVTHYNRYIY